MPSDKLCSFCEVVESFSICYESASWFLPLCLLTSKLRNIRLIYIYLTLNLHMKYVNSNIILKLYLPFLLPDP